MGYNNLFKRFETFTKLFFSEFWLLILILFTAVVSLQTNEALDLKICQPELISKQLSVRGGFDKDLHKKLQQHFPDWEDRMLYQERQSKFYKSAYLKQKELERVRIRPTSKTYSKQELDALDYFNGCGFYKRQQDYKQPPNIFDSRESFLLKMHNTKAREKFLDYYNSKSD